MRLRSSHLVTAACALAVLGSAIVPSIALADGVNLTNPLGSSDFRVILGSVIKAFLGLSGSIALVMVIYGGFLWLTSNGNPEKIDKGRKVLVWAFVGLAVIFSAYTLTSAIISALVVSSTT